MTMRCVFVWLALCVDKAKCVERTYTYMVHPLIPPSLCHRQLGFAALLVQRPLPPERVVDVVGGAEVEGVEPTAPLQGGAPPGHIPGSVQPVEGCPQRCPQGGAGVDLGGGMVAQADPGVGAPQRHCVEEGGRPPPLRRPHRRGGSPHGPSPARGVEGGEDGREGDEGGVVRGHAARLAGGERPGSSEIHPQPRRSGLVQPPLEGRAGGGRDEEARQDEAGAEVPPHDELRGYGDDVKGRGQRQQRPQRTQRIGAVVYHVRVGEGLEKGRRRRRRRRRCRRWRRREHGRRAP